MGADANELLEGLVQMIKWAKDAYRKDQEASEKTSPAHVVTINAVAPVKGETVLFNDGSGWIKGKLANDVDATKEYIEAVALPSPAIKFDESGAPYFSDTGLPLIMPNTPLSNTMPAVAKKPATAHGIYAKEMEVQHSHGHHGLELHLRLVIDNHSDQATKDLQYWFQHQPHVYV